MENYILESILKSSNIGMRGTVEAYIDELLKSNKNTYLNREDFKINDDFSVSCDGEIFIQTKMVETGVYIKEARKITVQDCDIKKFSAPLKCKYLKLTTLNELEKIVFKKGTKIDEVLIEYSGNGNISIEFEDKNDTQIGVFIIKNTSITSINDFPNISERLCFYNCNIVNDINLQQKEVIPILFKNCVIKKFTGIFSAYYLKFSDCSIKDINIKFKNINYIWLFNITGLKHITAVKNNNSSKLYSITVDNCKKLETITCNNVTNQLLFTNLPNISRFYLETNKNNLVFVQNCAVAPEVDCKIIVK